MKTQLYKYSIETSQGHSVTLEAKTHKYHKEISTIELFDEKETSIATYVSIQSFERELIPLTVEEELENTKETLADKEKELLSSKNKRQAYYKFISDIKEEVVYLDRLSFFNPKRFSVKNRILKKIYEFSIPYSWE